MSLVNDITAVLPSLRAEAEGRMVDRCIVNRGPYGPGTFDPGTGTYTPGAAVEIYAGVCEVQVDGRLVGREIDAGETELTTMRLTVKLPVVASADVQVDDEVLITSSAHDPGLVGKSFRVTALHNKTFATARRLQVEEVAQ
jgi:hypothetical protein